MEVTIHGLNVKVRDSLADYAKRKLDRLDRYLPGITEVRLDLSLQHTKNNGGMKIAEITVRHQRGAILRAEERVEGEFEAAINLAVDKMYRRIERFKGKRETKRRLEKFTATAEELTLSEAMPELAEAPAAVVAPPIETAPEEEIVRRKDVPVTSMTEYEAIEQMELLGHKFFLFYNPDTESMNVVYKRERGGYGLLVPQE